MDNFNNREEFSDYEVIDVTPQIAENSIVMKIKTPVFTFILIGINVLMWLFIEFYSRYKGVEYGKLLMDFGAKDNSRIMLGEYWRFLTPVFLHSGIEHLLLNSFSLYNVGVLVEKIFGHKKFLFIYFLSGLTGSFMSFIFTPGWGVGASGAIFGLLGALLYLGVEYPAFFKKTIGPGVIAITIINIGYGFVNTGIDNFAHIGGLIGGFLSAGSVRVDSYRKLNYRNIFILGTLIFIVTSLFFGFSIQRNIDITKFKSSMEDLNKLTSQQKYTEGERLAEEILGKKPVNEEILLDLYSELVDIKYGLGKKEEAFDAALKIKKINKAWGHYITGLLHLSYGDHSEGKNELLKAVKINAKYKESVDSILSEIK